MKKKSEITREYEYLKVDGRYFKPNRQGEKLLYVEVKPEEFEKRMNLVKVIADKMKNHLDKEAVLLEALSRLDDEYLENILGKLNSPRKKVTITTRKHHCVDMRVGGYTVPIV